MRGRGLLPRQRQWVQRMLELRERESFIDVDSPSVGAHFGPKVDASRRDGQIVALECFEEALGDLRVARDLIERQAQSFPRLSEQCTKSAIVS